MKSPIEQSIKEKIKVLAKEQETSFAQLWRNLILERFLTRLSQSAYRDKFVLKGGTLLAKYLPLGRETKDLDFFIQKLSNTEKDLENVLRSVCDIDVNDSFVFEMVKVDVLEHVHMAYTGAQISLLARFGATKTTIRMDLGFGDVVEAIDYRMDLTATTKGPLFESKISLRCYPKEFIFAEKLETVVFRGEENTRMKDAENWTKQVQNGGFVAQGRKESLDEIANIIKMNRHAILVGPSRVGKSLTAKAFAQAVERGDYPELKGKVVFRINTTDIVGQKASFLGGGNNILNKISAAMGRHRDDIILVLDEIHMACKNNEKIADQLKTFLDENGEFPHVIGITTEEEYDTHVKNNNAFSLRFDRVDIQNTSQDETMRILGDTLLRSRSKPLIKESALDQIYDKSCEVEDAPQPATALKLLKRCINRTEKTQKSPTEKKIIEVSNKILSLRSQAAASRGRKKEAKVQIAELEKQISELQEALRKEKKELDKLFKAKDLLDRVTKETYSSVLKISAIAQKTLNSKNEKQLKLFLLLHEFLGRSLESHIEETAETLGVKAVIDEELIDEVANA